MPNISDPALNIGTSAVLTKTGISGIANILPFTCLPGTAIESLSDQFKRDHNKIPDVSIAYDGQDNTVIDMRIQAEGACSPILNTTDVIGTKIIDALSLLINPAYPVYPCLVKESQAPIR